MQFAEDYFTSGRADPTYWPKYKTCLVRIPDTINSKCLSRGLRSRGVQNKNPSKMEWKKN